MSTRRLLAALLTVGLVAPVGAVVAASPATAATATKIVSGSDGKQWLSVNRYANQGGAGAVYNTDYVSFSINVEDTAGNQVYDGGLTVQRRKYGSSAWSTILTSTSAYLYKSIKVTGTATYRVLYAGTAEYSPTDASLGVKAQRKVTVQGISGKKVGFKGRVGPKGKVAILVQKKVGSKWKKFKTLRTKATGAYKIVLPAPRRSGPKFHWKVTFKPSKGFLKSVFTGTTYRY